MTRIRCLLAGAVAGVALLIAGTWSYVWLDEWQQARQIRDPR